MNIDQLIAQLKSSRLIAECSDCGQSFPLSKAVMFDGLGDFPEAAQLTREAMLSTLQQRLDELKGREHSAGPGAEKKAIEVGIGKIIEKVVPAYKGFGFPICDCRPLFEPIDMIIFNGLSKASVESITFMEIKTGASRLKDHQKLVKDAVCDGKVGFKVV